MRYLPKSDSDRARMLAAIGVESVDQLFCSIPEPIKLPRPLDLPPALSEPDLLALFRSLSERNAVGFTSFRGAGVYHHFIPLIVDHLISRSEFYSAYTPYQAEISQGTLQSIFEFQTLMCQLTGMEVANASMYDGATAVTESVFMARRITDRDHVVVAQTVHPAYRRVLRTYTQHLGMKIHLVAYNESGQVDLDDLKKRISSKVAAVVIQSPNFFGNIESLEEIAQMAHEAGALLIVTVAEALSLGILWPPGAPKNGVPLADIVAGEAQSLGIPPSFGGPLLGFIGTQERYMRQIPGRLVGQTVDADGKRGFVLTLSTREQHIRREKATSNICTNQALCALMTTIFLATLGKNGLRELALQNVRKAHYALEQLRQLPQIHVLFNGPRFNEFVIEVPKQLRPSDRALRKRKMIGALPLKAYFPRLKHAELVCITEKMSKEQIDEWVQLYAELP